MKRHSARTGRGLLALLALAFLCACSERGEETMSTEETYAETEAQLIVDIPRIGKADCAILTDGEHCIMIDCGEADDAEELLSKLALRGAEKLDLMILTHFDSDHIGSAAAILASVPTERILLPDHSPEADDLSDYRACMEAAAKSGAELCYVHDTEELTLGGIKLTVYGAGDAEYTKNRENNRSLLLLVEHAQNRLFFAGDAEKQRLEDWLAGETVRADFLKLPHHGSYNKALPDLLASVGMRSAVITCSAKNPPDEKTLLALGDCETYLTADGDVTIISDRAGLSLRQG